MFLPYHYLYLRIENGNYSRLQFLNRENGCHIRDVQGFAGNPQFPILT